MHTPLRRRAPNRSLAALLVVAACAPRPGTPSSADTGAPAVVMAAPADGATGVALDASIIATFSEAMDPASLATAVSLTGPAGALAGTALVSPDARTVTFVPVTPLDPAALYTAAVAEAARDAAGNRLARAAAWSFRTVDTIPPRVSGVSPAAGVSTSAALTPTVTATFDEPIDCAALPPAALAVTEAGARVAGDVTCSGATLEFVPVPTLPTGTSLVASVSPQVRDLAGNPLGTPRVWSFDVLPWTRQLGSAREDAGRSVATDAAGNVVVAGYTMGELDGNRSANGADFAIVKYDPSGARLWVRQLPTMDSMLTSCVATDAAGNILVSGEAWGGATGGFPPVPYHAFVSKLDPAGATLWTHPLGSVVNDSRSSVATDLAGNVVAAGSTFDALDGTASAGGSDLFVVKYDPSGVKLWTARLGSSSDDHVTSVATDAAGNAFVTGDTEGALDGNASAGGSDLFVVKYDPSGARLWSRQLGSAGSDYGMSVATDAAGNAFVAGYTFDALDGNASAGATDLFVVKYDPSGAKLWSRQLGSAGSDYGMSVATDAAGNAFVTGHTLDALDGNGSAGGSDFFVVKYDPSGVRLWTTQAGSASYDYGMSVATDAAGNAFVTGGTSGALDGNTAAGESDLFVVKLDRSGRLR